MALNSLASSLHNAALSPQFPNSTIRTVKGLRGDTVNLSVPCEVTTSAPRVPVVMCVWKRVNLLPVTLDLLCRQQGVEVDFYIWNNNAAAGSEVERFAASYRAWMSIEVRHSLTNVACIGRFWLAQELRRRYPFVVFIDDDQYFGETFLFKLWCERTLGGVTACHCRDFVPGKDYWNRTMPAPGEPAQYCGPGGMIMDARLLASKEFRKCPKASWIMDDIWLSHLLGHSGRRRSSVRRQRCR